MMVGVLDRPAHERTVESILEQYATPTLEVQMLGAFRLSMAGRPIPATLWAGSTRARSLFQYLAYRAGTPLGKQQLIDRLWPDLEPDACLNTLYKAVHFLRQRLGYITGRDGRELLAYDEGCYTLRTGGLHVDAVAFRRATFEANWCERLGDRDGQMRHLTKALGLYGGDLLEDDYLVEWAIPERDRLRHDLCLALKQAARLVRAAGERDLAATYYRQLLTVDPLSEDGYQALIEMALDAGQRGAAVRLYAHYEETLQRELSLAPGARLQALMAAL